MALILIIPILVSGFLHFHLDSEYKYKRYKFNGQLLYLMVLFYGIAYTLASILIVIPYFSQWLIEIKSRTEEILVITGLSTKDDANLYFNLILVTSLGIMLPILCSGIKILVNLSWYKSKKDRDIHLRRASVPQDSMELFIINALSSGEEVLITLENKKVYVGSILNISSFDDVEKPGQNFSIKLKLSGYLDKDTLIINITADYSNIKDTVEVYLKLTSVSSICKFHANIKDYVTKDTLIVSANTD